MLVPIWENDVSKRQTQDLFYFMGWKIKFVVRVTECKDGYCKNIIINFETPPNCLLFKGF